jgi:mono/diheme cytochrome c family protein
VVFIQLPPKSATLKAGPGEDLARARCPICHSADYVYTQPPLPAAKWKAGVEKMGKVFGCPIPDADVDALAKYPTSQNEL